ncbi:MAG TPA: hypothetical protein VGH28_29065 [Polyangiaceae bacterium]|jgi:hypothetical protein
MNTNTPQKKLAEELDRIAARYESQFAGMPRSSRNVDELDTIIDETKGILARIESIPEAVRPPDLGELAETARRNVAIYQRERALILDAVRVGPAYERFSILATSANFVFARYRRHFAGKSRVSRDLGLLDEMIEDLESIEEAMQGVIAEAKKGTGASELAKDVKLVKSSLEMYRSERTQIAKARKDGTPEERASLMAQLANDQFRIYANHFSDKSRVTRRPALLIRVIDQLGTIREMMLGLKKGGLTGVNDDNLGIVERNLETYKKELEEIRAARKEVGFSDLLGLLGGAANTVFEAYRAEFAGQDRKTRDLDRLSALCDELGDLRRQMIEVGRAHESASNDSNIDVISAQLGGFELEWDNITLAKK